MKTKRVTVVIVLAVALENEEEYNSDIESAEIDELLNMINAKA